MVKALENEIERGTSESEIIRQAIDREASKLNPGPNEATRRQAWEEAYEFMRSLHAQGLWRASHAGGNARISMKNA